MQREMQLLWSNIANLQLRLHMSMWSKSVREKLSDNLTALTLEWKFLFIYAYSLLILIVSLIVLQADLPEHLSRHCFRTWMKWVFSN